MITAVSALTGGVAGEAMTGLATPLLGKSAASVIGGGIGGFSSGISGHLTGDVYDQLLNGKTRFDPVSDYMVSGAIGGGMGATLAMLSEVSIQSSRYLEGSASRTADIYAQRFPAMTGVLEKVRRAGAGQGVKLSMTVKELLELLRSGLGGPGGPSALAVAGSGDVRTLSPNTRLRVRVASLHDLNRPMQASRPAESSPREPSGDNDVAEHAFRVEEVELESSSPKRWRDALGGEDDPTCEACMRWIQSGGSPISSACRRQRT